uniref:HTH cro/C1-type domain-containing protein n=1 Tax=Borrelia lonestari TaxID=38876 RepID=A4ZZ40_9SPIR|nr:hypothetical protein [Borrelia lonestari]
MQEDHFIRFGDFLKKIRLDKGLTLEMISDDIKISVKYLKALEDSNLELFPNEVLISGFLRAYSEYLGVDVWYVSSLFKQYKRDLNSHYIGIKAEEQNISLNFINEGGLREKYFDILKIDFFKMVKILLSVVSVIVLMLLILNFFGIKRFVGKLFSANHVSGKTPEFHKIIFDKENFWNVILKEGDFLSLIYDSAISEYKISFLNDDLVMTNNLENGRYIFKLGESQKINLNNTVKVKMIYENYSRSNSQEAHISLESIVLNVGYVFETNLSSRFNILNWGFEVNGPKGRVISEYPTVYFSQDMVTIDLVINFLNNTFLRYADESNLYGQSLLAAKGVPLNLTFKNSIILFLSRLSDMNIVIQGKDITSSLKSFGNELMAVQFFWLKNPRGFELKISEVY